MNKISLIFPYYKNSKMLEYQMNVWREYPASVKENLEIIIVDDGSPIGLRAEEVIKASVEKFGHLDFDFSLFRILIDIPWNECGAKNLGVSHASNPWLLISDIDHIVTSQLLEHIQNVSLDRKLIYGFTRKHRESGEVNKPHQETILVSIGKFTQVGWYDESYCGHYAFCAGEFIRRLDLLNTVTRIEIPLERVDYLFIPDAKTAGLVRKEGRDDSAYDDIKAWKEEVLIGIETLKLPWKEVSCD